MAFIQPLETRILFAYIPYPILPTPNWPPPPPAIGVSVANGTLTVNGTNYSDTITVDAGSSVVKVTGSTFSPWGFSTINKTFNAAGLSKFIVEARGGDDSVTLKGGTGNLNFDDPTFIVRGGSGDDTMNATQAGIALLDGQGGADTFHGTSLTAVDYSSRTADLYIDRSTPGNDGEAGENDTIGAAIGEIRCGEGNDTVLGSQLANHDDRVFGNGGNDVIVGFGGGDFLHGGAGSDTLVGGTGVDVLMGGWGDDLIYAGGDSHNDYVYGDDSSGNPDTGFDRAYVDPSDGATDIDQFL